MYRHRKEKLCFGQNHFGFKLRIVSRVVIVRDRFGVLPNTFLNSIYINFLFRGYVASLSCIVVSSFDCSASRYVPFISHFKLQPLRCNWYLFFLGFSTDLLSN